jgi:protein gp37
MDARHDKDSSIVTKTNNFNLPIKKDRKGNYKIPSGELVYTCFTSDFFLDDADEWRKEAWKMIKERSDLRFFIITKRIDRFNVSLPEDWNDGYDNVTVGSTVENQDRADYRLPIFIKAPIKHKYIICEPLLGKIDLSQYLGSWVELVVVGGESGNEARVCDYEWVIDIRRQCIEKNISFYFKQTGAKFLKDGKLYKIKREFQHKMARKAGINYTGKKYEHKTQSKGFEQQISFLE